MKTTVHFIMEFTNRHIHPCNEMTFVTVHNVHDNFITKFIQILLSDLLNKRQ